MNGEEICLWADGTWCYWDQLIEYSYMSDDYTILKFGTEEYDAFMADLNSVEHF